MTSFIVYYIIIQKEINIFCVCVVIETSKEIHAHVPRELFIFLKHQQVFSIKKCFLFVSLNSPLKTKKKRINLLYKFIYNCIFSN